MNDENNQINNDASSLTPEMDNDETERLIHHLNDVTNRSVELVRRYASIDPAGAGGRVRPVVVGRSEGTPELDQGQDSENYNNNSDNDNDANSKRTEEEENPWNDPEAMLATLKKSRDELSAAWKAWSDHHHSQQQQQQQHKRKQQQQPNNNSKENDNEKEEDEVEPDEKEFRVLYMDMITDAFGDVLDQMRRQEEEEQEERESQQQQQNPHPGSVVGPSGIDVDMLVDCLQSGIEFLDPSDQNKQFLEDLDEMNDNNDDGVRHDVEDGDDDIDIADRDQTNLTCHQKRQMELGYISSPPSLQPSNVPTSIDDEGT